MPKRKCTLTGYSLSQKYRILSKTKNLSDDSDSDDASTSSDNLSSTDDDSTDTDTTVTYKLNRKNATEPTLEVRRENDEQFVQLREEETIIQHNSKFYFIIIKCY